MVFKDRVKEITRTVGTVDYDVDGAYATFQGFNAFTDGDETYYCCDDGTNCEVGKGTISSSGTKISRDEIVFSTNGNNLVDWPVGDKTIFCVFPSTEIMGLLASVLNIAQELSDHVEADNPHGIGVNTIGVENIISAIDSALGSTDWRTGGGGGGAGQTETTITQTTHGLSVLNVVRSYAGVWSKAKADDVATLGLGLVVAVGDADTFSVAMSGFYELTAHGLTVDEYYYLSDTTAGALTETEPDISQPVLYVVDANNIVVLPYRPISTSAIGGGGGWDYVSTSDPTISTNPATYPVSWLNTTTGEEFICNDNTSGANVWRCLNTAAPVHAKVYGDQTLNYPDNVDTDMLFTDTEAEDDWGMLDADGYGLTIPDWVPDNSQFLCVCNMRTDAGSDSLTITLSIRVNSIEEVGTVMGGTQPMTYLRYTESATLTLSAGDNVNFIMKVSNSDGTTHFEGYVSLTQLHAAKIIQP